MADSAAEILNKFLPMYDHDDVEYKNLVGDRDRGDLTASYTSTVDGSGNFNLLTNYNVRIAFDDGTAQTIDCRGGTPAATTLVEVVNAINAAFAGTASHDGTYITVASTGSPPTAAVTLTPPSVKDATLAIFGLAETTGYKYRYPYNIPVRINDMNRGALANALEYLRRQSRYLKNQLVLTTAIGDELILWGRTVYGIDKPPGWSDAAYRAFIVTRIMDINCGPVWIQEALAPYAATVQIIEGIDDGAFADVSFSDCYVDFAGPPVVKAALAGDSGGMPFFFRVILTGVSSSDYMLIVDIVEACRAGGTTYLIQVS